MENDEKVFHSEISRVDCETESHLYELLKIEPAVPVRHHLPNTNIDGWEFKPNCDKQYTQRRVKSKLKVSTVKDVRALFENDVYCFLPSDLERQHNYLLRKIRDGFSTEEKTKDSAIALLNGDTPISRSAWQMLSNMNPEKHNNPKQFVLWNSKCIQVNGSRGGKCKFICNHDLKNKVKKSPQKSPPLRSNVLKRRTGLLRNSLNVKFKPGPLGKKKNLDVSHHKYQMGDIELVELPAPLLEISPAYGTALEPMIANFVNSLRGEKGEISSKFAEFAVSVVGTVKNNTALPLDENCSVTFNLDYKCKQNRVLMRRNILETTACTNNDNNLNCLKLLKAKSISNEVENTHTELAGDKAIFEVKEVIKDILNAVDISLNQDFMYSKEDESRDTISDDVKDLSASKDKITKRKYCELDKLDVTIIKLPETSKKSYNKPCDKSFCTMGCVCESLDSELRLKQHCGVIDCMFGCKCEVPKYRNIDFLEQECGDIIIPGLVNLDNEINSHLTKEEQKFHQTVIVSGEKSIVLKSRKRSWKCSNKYAEFYSQMNLKVDEKIKKILTVDVERLCCNNVEPLCMVHNLYKCFCKGKFTESFICSKIEKSSENTKIEHEKSIEPESGTRNILRPRIRKMYGNHKKVTENNSNGIEKNLNKILTVTENAGVTLGETNRFQKNSCCSDDDDVLFCDSCARTVGYHGRKHSDDYYSITNRKILEMEKNDSLLKNKMFRLINGNTKLPISEPINNSSELLDCETLSDNSGDSSSNIYNDIPNKAGDKNKLSNQSVSREGSNYPFVSAATKRNLKDWLEISYKLYKERLAKGIVKNCLEPPMKGKAALQTWDFVLSRYRDRKNIFFVSKQEPFRTFLAVDDKHPFFATCRNIDDIHFRELSKYPLIVQNLVTCAYETENSFCILRGWDHCWELIGSAVKVYEHNTKNHIVERNSSNIDNVTSDNSIDSGNDSWTDQQVVQSSIGHDCTPLQDNESDEVETPKKSDIQSEKSKWFVLTIENDFTDLQFYKKGFYVTYEGIQRSIRLARISGKTVRLSSRVRVDKTQNNSHPYGIYAIPCVTECCVFIGPYEEDEPLGIEVVKSLNTGTKKTRGVWITTNKIENKEVVDNPLAYIPAQSAPSETIPAFEAVNYCANPKQPTTIHETTKVDEQKNDEEKTPEKARQRNKKGSCVSNQIKPIRIRRTDGFYHLSSKNILQLKTGDISANKRNTLKKPATITLVAENALTGPSTSSAVCIKPIAEVAPQIKITHVYSESTLQSKLGIPEKSKGSAMLILKPEEINQKALAQPTSVNDEIGKDIEQFLETTTICIAPQEDVMVISDEEDEETTSHRDIWIQCRNIKNFGYLRAKTTEDRISFEFPGFKYSEFYTEAEAFDKINQVLARKIYIPRNAKLEWEVVHEKQSLTCEMLTPKCLIDKKYLLVKLREQRDKKVGVKVPSTKAKSETSEKRPYKNKHAQMKLIQGLEEASRQLEQQSAVLWKEAVTRRDEILDSLSVPDNLKEQMSETLQDMMALNEGATAADGLPDALFAIVPPDENFGNNLPK